MMCELETNCVALERIFEYIENKQEDEWEKPGDKEMEKESKNWPSQGMLQFDDYQTRYRYFDKEKLKDSFIFNKNY